MPATAAAFVAAAAAELGYTESPAGSNRTKFAAEAGHANGQPWCATFLVAIARRTGQALPSTSAYTPTMAQGFKAVGRWHTTDPLPGDFVFFDFPDAVRRIQHVGVLEHPNDDGSLIVIEANTSPGTTGSQANGGGVWRRRRARGLVVGYGRPAYVRAAAPAPAPTSRRILVVNHVRSLVAPNGGLWHLQADGGVITTTDGDASPEAPYCGSIPEPGDAAVLPTGSKAIDLLPFRGGYMIVAQHADSSVSTYHFPAA